MEEKQLSAKIPESEEEQEKVIKFLEERLEKHVEDRRVVQGKFTEIQNKLVKQIDDLEDRINRELWEEFTPEEDRLQTAFNKLRGSSTINSLRKAKVELSAIQSYEITENKEPNNDITVLYRLKIYRSTIPEDGSVGLSISEVNSSTHSPFNAKKKGKIPYSPDKLAEERERLVKLLEERIQTHDNNRKAVQDKIHEICERLRAQISELEDRINKELEEKFTSEDNRLQAALNELRGNRTASALQKAKAELLAEQSYDVIENSFDSKHDLTTLCELKAERQIAIELIERKPTNVHVTDVSRGRVSIQFTFLNPDEEKVLSDHNLVDKIKYKCLLFKKDNEQEGKEYPLERNEGNDSFLFMPDILGAETTYGIRVKIVFEGEGSEWSNEIAEFTTPGFKGCCMWKKCPDDVDEYKKYSVDEKNSRVATKINDCHNIYCTIIGDTHIPSNKVTLWCIKVLKSKYDNGSYIYIGIAPNDINQNKGIHNDYNGWYFECCYSKLYSGPPHNYWRKEYGPRKKGKGGQYVNTGDSVGVVMDTTKGELSFILNCVNYGAAYKRIPLDKPLVPCVLLYHGGDSVELI